MLDFLFLITIAVSVVFPAGTGLTVAFFSGLMADFWNLTTLGTTSLLFLAISLLANLYKRRFKEMSLGYGAGLTAAAGLFRDLIMQEQLSLERIFLLTILALPMMTSARILFEKIRKEKQLKLELN